MKEIVYLLELDAHDGSGVVTLRFASTGYTTKPSETPANAWYEPRLIQPGLYRLDAWLPGWTDSRSGYGEITLNNADSALDYLADYAVDGRQLRLLAGIDGAAYSSFVVLLRGTALGFAWEKNRVSIRLRDRQAELDKALQSTRYAGTNSLPNGLEGTASDIKGQVKPWLFGQVFNISPPLVNTSRLIWQIHDGTLNSVDAVYDAGVALTAGAAYTSQSDMETNAPAAGQYRAWLAGGYIRLGSSPAGQITVDATQGASAAARYPGQAVNAIALKAGLTSGEISSGDVSALDSAAPYALGVWIGDETTAASALDAVALSCGAWWTFDSTGALRFGQLTAPTGAAVLSLTSAEVIEIERIATGDAAGLPPKKILIGHARNYTPQADGLAGSVTAARRAWLKEAFRYATAESSAIAARFLLAPDVTLNTPIVNAADAQTEADRLNTLRATRRDTVRATVRLPLAQAAAVTLGQRVDVKTAKLGYAAGRAFRVIGLVRDLRIGKLELLLWG